LKKRTTIFNGGARNAPPTRWPRCPTPCSGARSRRPRP